MSWKLLSFMLLFLLVKSSTQCAKRETDSSDVRIIKAERRFQLPMIREENRGGKILEDEMEEFKSLEERARSLGLEKEEAEDVMKQREGKQTRVLNNEDQDGVKACYSLIRPEWKLYDAVVREKLNRFDVSSCAGECKNRVYCRAFAFSESEFLAENCYLSELSDDGGETGLQVTRDGQSHAMWGLYTVAESCEESTTTTSTIGNINIGIPFSSASDGCKCNGFIDHQGEGACRTTDNLGRYWCYTDSNSTCLDSVQDPFLKFLSRTIVPCSQGPCQCNPYNFKRSGSQNICMGDVFDTSTFCYVTLDSRCPDKQPSKFFPSFQWSMVACSPYSSSFGNEGQARETHGQWNFTSSYLDCIDYCNMAERCKSMHTHYDNDLKLCFLSTRPLVVTAYSHAHQPHPLHTHYFLSQDVETIF